MGLSPGHRMAQLVVAAAAPLVRSTSKWSSRVRRLKLAEMRHSRKVAGGAGRRRSGSIIESPRETRG